MFIQPKQADTHNRKLTLVNKNPFLGKNIPPFNSRLRELNTLFIKGKIHLIFFFQNI